MHNITATLARAPPAVWDSVDTHVCEVGARIEAQVQAGAVQEARYRVRAAVLLHRSHLKLMQSYVFTTYPNAIVCTFAAL